MYTPVNPSFIIQKWGVRGYTLHGLVIMMHVHMLIKHVIISQYYIIDIEEVHVSLR